MESIKTFEESVIQNRLNQYFNTGREVNIEGRKFNIMPSKNDVPLIKRLAYTPSTDLFEIVFHSHDAVKSIRQDKVEFLENSDGCLIGIRIYEVKKNNINRINVIVSTLENVIKRAEVSLAKNPSLKDIAHVNIEQRKIDFLKNFFEEELNKLIEA